MCSEALFDGRTGQQHGVEIGHGRDRAEFADLKADGEQLGAGPLGGVLVGDAPARETAGLAEDIALIELSTLMTTPSVSYSRSRAAFVPFVDEGEHLVDVFHRLKAGLMGMPHCLKCLNSSY